MTQNSHHNPNVILFHPTAAMCQMLNTQSLGRKNIFQFKEIHIREDTFICHMKKIKMFLLQSETKYLLLFLFCFLALIGFKI